MRNFVTALTVLMFTASSALASQTCKSVGFDVRDGIAIPIVECSGTPSYDMANDFGGGALSYWGMLAKQGHRLKSESLQLEGLESQSNNSNSNTSKSSDSMDPSSAGSRGLSQLPKVSIELQNSLQTDMRNLDKSLNAVNELYNQARAAAAPPMTSEQIVGAAGAIAAFQIAQIEPYIYSPMRSRIEYERKFGANFEKVFSEANLRMIQAAQGDLSEIEKSDSDKEVTSKSINKNLPPQLQRIVDTIRNNARGSSDLRESLPVTADAAAALIQSGSADQRAHAGAALALALASANAVMGGMIDVARTYAFAATTTLDIALGFVPVAGSINDLAQIAFGIATGHSYTGQKMTTSDYALRAFGVVLGIIPVAYLGKIAITADFLKGTEP